MTLFKQTLSALTLVTGLSLAASAQATVFSYDVTNPPGSSSAGDVASFHTKFNDVTEQLSFSSTITKNSGTLADGFWLVLSDGPNPKDHFDEYAIFYGDAATGNLTSYVYNGLNDSSSWTGDFIESFAGGLSVDDSVTDEITFGFSIDASFINSFYATSDWDGASFDESIGIWYHPADFGSSSVTYNSDGSLASFPVARAGWYDAGDLTTVPEPAVLSLLAVGLIGVGVSRRKRHI